MYYPPSIETLLPSMKVSVDNVRMSKDDFRKLLFHFLLDVEVDQDWYLEAYPDVSVAIGEGLLSSAKQHFLEAGYLEGRLPCAPNFDLHYYFNRYPDIAEAYEAEVVQNPEEHFLHVGRREARMGCNFPVDEAWYLETYGVKLSGDTPSAKDHFDQFGYNAGFRPFPSSV